MSAVDTEAILFRALNARLAGDLSDQIAQDIADLVTEVRSHRSEQALKDPDNDSFKEPQAHAVTGTYHPVGPVRSGPVGRRAVGFQHREPR